MHPQLNRYKSVTLLHESRHRSRGGLHSSLHLSLSLICFCSLQGAAVEDGRLKRGDQIIAVNGHCLEGATHAEAVDILKRTKGTVVLTVLS